MYSQEFQLVGSVIIYIRLGYLKDRNAAAHSVDSDIFYGVIYLSVHSKTCSNISFSK